MRHCRKVSFIFLVFFSAYPAFSVPHPSNTAKPDTILQSAVPANKQTVGKADTSIKIEDLVEDHAAPAQTAPEKKPLAKPADSLGLLGQFAGTAQPADTLHVNMKEMFRTMGNFHKVMGIYNVSAGILAIIAGAAILEKEDILPFSLSLITLGGITVGIGVWEITIGRTLSR
jgi:hypothetical protein